MAIRGLCLLLGLLLLAPAACGLAESAEGFEFADAIPAEYRKAVSKGGGMVLRFKYQTKDYTNDEAEITKFALIYLPPDYSKDNRYDLLILCHGIGGNEQEWGFANRYCVGKAVLDHLILNGDIPPMIVVMPNGRSTAKYSNTGWDNMGSFYYFGKELRNDLLPYIDANYPTYGSDTPDDLSASRNHRAMAGLSMGGMQTINIGIAECLDLFSAFGAFSAAPTTIPDVQIATALNQPENLDLPIRYFYSICGTEDGTAYASASGAAKNLPDHTDRMTEKTGTGRSCRAGMTSISGTWGFTISHGCWARCTNK